MLLMQERRILLGDVVGGISAGSQQGVIAERIRRVTSGAFGKYRAKMIARTEMGEAVNIAKTKSSNDWSEQTGQRQGKLWIHRGLTAQETGTWRWMMA